MLPLWIEFFEDLQLVRGRSQNTVMAYRRDLELWAEYQKNSTSISGFYEYMKQQGLSTRSQARVISSLRTYFKFIENQGMKAPELRELRPPKVKAGLPKVLSIEEFENLFVSSATEKKEKTIRNQLCLLLLFHLGCRVSELIALDLSDYRESEGVLKILGKGQKERLVPVAEGLALALRDYFDMSRPLLAEATEKSLLINDRGHRPSRVDIWRWLAAWSKEAGFSEPLSPHRFRHGCATALLESGADLRSIQTLLGHSSIQTTQIYTTVTSQNLTQTIEAYHPLAKLKEV